MTGDHGLDHLPDGVSGDAVTGVLVRIADSGELIDCCSAARCANWTLQLSARLVEQCRDVLRAELVERLAHLHELHEIVGSQLIAEGILDRDIGVGRGAPRHHRTDRKTFAGTQGQGRIFGDVDLTGLSRQHLAALDDVEGAHRPHIGVTICGYPSGSSRVLRAPRGRPAPSGPCGRTASAGAACPQSRRPASWSLRHRYPNLRCPKVCSLSCFPKEKADAIGAGLKQ